MGLRLRRPHRPSGSRCCRSCGSCRLPRCPCSHLCHRGRDPGHPGVHTLRREVCSTETVATQEIEYEKVCTEIVDTLCDAPVAHAVAHYAAAPVAAPVAVAHAVAPLPVAHAVAHSVTETVKHACREVTTEHCVDNPKVIEVPVEVEHCHTVTKVTCA